MTPAVWSWGRLFFPSNQINKDSSVLHAPLPLVSPSPRPCHEVTGSRCQEAGWPLLGLAACWSQPAWPCLFPASSPPPTFFLSAILFSPFPRLRWPIWWPDLLAPKSSGSLILGLLGRTWAETCVACGSSRHGSGGGAGGATSWYSAYPCSDHPVGCLTQSARITRFLRVGLGLISPCIPSPRGALWLTPPSPAACLGWAGQWEGRSLGWVQWFCTCPIKALREKT